MGRPLRRVALTILALFAVFAGGFGYVSNAAQEGVQAGGDPGFYLIGPPLDADCRDFATRLDAQRFFGRNSPDKDPHGLDRDEDRNVCEGFEY